jgi:hypothetical protein
MAQSLCADDTLRSGDEQRRQLREEERQRLFQEVKGLLHRLPKTASRWSENWGDRVRPYNGAVPTGVMLGFEASAHDEGTRRIRKDMPERQPPPVCAAMRARARIHISDETDKRWLVHGVVFSFSENGRLLGSGGSSHVGCIRQRFDTEDVFIRNEGFGTSRDFGPGTYRVIAVLAVCSLHTGEIHILDALERELVVSEEDCFLKPHPEDRALESR